MSKLRGVVFLAVVAILAGSALATDTAFIQGAATTDQVALFAAFVVNVPAIGEDSAPIRTAFSIGNIMSAPEGLLGGEWMTTDRGVITFFLFRSDGEVRTVSTADIAAPESLGNGVLNEDGELLAGKTLAVFMDEILVAAGGNSDDVFTGYMWVVCDFDAAAGTYTTYHEGIGFAQAFKMDPVLGASFTWGGLPVGGIPVGIE